MFGCAVSIARCVDSASEPSFKSHYQLLSRTVSLSENCAAELKFNISVSQIQILVWIALSQLVVASRHRV